MVCLCVVRRKGARCTEAELKTELKAGLADFKVPQYILFLERLPETLTGKVRVQELKDLARETLGLTSD